MFHAKMMNISKFLSVREKLRLRKCDHYDELILSTKLCDIIDEMEKSEEVACP